MGICCRSLSVQMIGLQRALSKTKWKEYFSNGRKYYYNVRCFLSFCPVQLLILILQTETKESKWEMPEEVLRYVNEVQEETKQAGQENARYFVIDTPIIYP
jgi:pre-mRNA-processing factor 40